MTRYFDGGGQEITALEYYQRLLIVARSRQRAFPWYSAARRRWRALEKQYAYAVQALDNVVP